MSRLSDPVFIGNASYIRTTLLVQVEVLNILEQWATDNNCNLSQALSEIILNKENK